MLQISEEEIQEDVTFGNHSNHSNVDQPPDILTMIQEVALCRKISLIDDLILSRKLRGCFEETSEIECLRETSVKELINQCGTNLKPFIEFKVITSSKSEKNDSFLLPYLSKIIKKVELSNDVESYIKNVLSVTSQHHRNSDHDEDFDNMNHSELPFKIPIRIVATLINHESSSQHQQDISQHQAIRDIERDVICVNGKTVIGSELSYDGIIQFLIERMRSLIPQRAKTVTCLSETLISHSNDRFTFEEDMFHFQSLFDSFNQEIHTKNNSSCTMNDDVVLLNFASLLLRAVNRTESGHWSFAMVSALCNNPNFSVVVPDSSAATPLNIDISLGPLSVPRKSTLQDHNQPPVIGWGFRAAVETTTFYDIYDAECNNVMMRMKASFAHCLVLPLGRHFSPQTIQGKVGWERLGQGSVSIFVHQVA